MINKNTLPKDIELVSNIEGEIGEIIMTLPLGYENPTGPMRNLYNGIIHALGREPLYIFLVDKTVFPTFFEIIEKTFPELNFRMVHNNSDPPTQFVQDEWVAFHKKGFSNEKFFALQSSCKNFNLCQSARLAVKAAQAEEFITQFPFRGGNVLSGDGFVLVGKNLLASIDPNRSIIENADWLKDKLEITQRIIPVGGLAPVYLEPFKGMGIRFLPRRKFSWQPVFHIDMFLTLAGRALDGRPRVVMGVPVSGYGGPLPQFCFPFMYDEVRAELEEEGFQVVDCPLPLYRIRTTREVIWYYATFSNGLVAATPRSKNAYLPDYDIEGIDPFRIEVCEVWDRLGFEVQLIGDCKGIVKFKGGAINCITNVSKRIPLE